MLLALSEALPQGEALLLLLRAPEPQALLLSEAELHGDREEEAVELPLWLLLAEAL